jgi:O-methyltransferase involved in polyketide biosynthesis
VHMCAPLQYPRPVYVGADLAVTPLAGALAAKGFEVSKPTLFTCEGILCYLPQVCAGPASLLEIL